MILVDGRFRVACTLNCLLNLAPESSCEILVDDYLGNSHYRSIENFGDLVAAHGRMAVFRKRARMEHEACREAITEFLYDFR